MIPTTNSYILSLVVTWVAPDGTVPTTAPGKPLTMTVTSTSIKKGASVYGIAGASVVFLGVASQDGVVTVSITQDPEVVIVKTKPSAPTNLSATTGADASSVVTWTAPASTGGDPITSYIVTASDGQSCVTTLTRCTFSSLTNGSSYTFTVVAANGVGLSDASTPSPSITPASPTPPPPAALPTNYYVAPVKPGTPQNVVATQSSGIVTVSWSASGSPAQYFTVSSVVDGNVCIVSGATTCTLANPLNKGQKRSYAVVATNTAGDSAPGYSNEVSVPLDVAPTTTTTIPTVPPVVVPKITLTCFFAFNSSDLSASAKAQITTYAKQIIARHITTLTLAGYTDFIEGKAYNQKLSTSRAKAVGVYLLLQLRSMSHTGISVRMIGKGISRTSPERAQDRKVTVIS